MASLAPRVRSARLLVRAAGSSVPVGAMLVIVACTAPAAMVDDSVGQGDATSKKPVTGTQGTQVTEVDASVADSAAPPPACTTVPPNNRCGLAPQCGCGVNETCDVTNVATGATSCVSAGGATLGRPCTQTGDCLAGLTCSYGACRPYCGTARSKCGVAGTGLCVEVVGNDNKPITNDLVCTINCDPRVPSAVCGTNACEWYATYYAPSKVSDCNFAGTVKAYDAACVDTTDCLPGLACVNNPKHGMRCEAWCRMGQTPSDCPNNFQCQDVFGADAPVIGGVTEGVCE